MKKLTLLFLSFCFISSLFAQKDYEEAFKLIEVWLDAQKDYEKLPGISVAVVKDQEVMWSGGFGMANIENKVKADANTICSICSISKLFTSVAIMKLYDQGKLRLDDKVSDLLPWFDLEQQYKDSGPITVRSLMTHSSGLPRESNHPYWTGPDFPFPSTKEVIAGLKEQETLYPASTYFQYSNLGLTLLGEIVAEVSGQSFDDYVQQNILEPLGLENTRTDLPEAKYGKELAIGYSAMTRQGNRNKVNLFQANGIKAAAGFSSNVLDLSKFASWVFRLRDTTTAEILMPATLRNMQRVHWMNPDWGTTWGLGFVVRKGPNGNTWVGHGGSCPGYRSLLQLNLKTKMAYAIMINAGGTSPGKYMDGIAKILSKVSGEADELEENVALEDYVGYYSSQPWGSETYMSTWEGKLVEIGLPANSPRMTMYRHIEGDIFRRIRRNGELGEALVFERDTNGKVYRAQSHGNFSNKMEDPKQVMTGEE